MPPHSLRGMFAFALWDARLQRLMLARDHFGIKPLYTAECNGRLYFASEIRALLAWSEMPRGVNVGALGAFLAAGFLTSPHTMFKDVQKLPGRTTCLRSAAGPPSTDTGG